MIATQPQPSQPESAAKSPPRRRYTTLWVLLGLFSLPYALAAVFWFTEDLRESLPLANNGMLITPLLELPAARLPTVDGRELALGELRGQWILLYANTGGCDRACEQTLYYMRQVRLAMGRERFLIERAALLPATIEPRIFEELAVHQAEMYVVAANAAGPLLEALGPLPADHGRLYVVDREGRAALYFDELGQPKDLLNDLKRLIGGRSRG